MQSSREQVMAGVIELELEDLGCEAQKFASAYFGGHHLEVGGRAVYEPGKSSAPPRGNFHAYLLHYRVADRAHAERTACSHAGLDGGLTSQNRPEGYVGARWQ